MANPSSLIIPSLSLGVLLADVFLAISLPALLILKYRKRSGLTEGLEKGYSLLAANSLFLAFLVALFSTIGSLALSEVLKMVPCELCWVQRFLMYPVAAFLLLGLLKKNLKGKAILVSIILSAVGALFALYHYSIQLGAASGVCKIGSVSCSTVEFVSYGYITIPIMSLTGFLLIIFFLTLEHWTAKKEKPHSKGRR